MKIAIVTDSVAYLPEGELAERGVYVMPLSINFDGKTYREGIDLSPVQFYDLVRGAENLPTSSQPAVGETMELFEKLAKEYDAAIVITLSAAISGTYQTVYSLKDDYSPLAIYPVDSRRAGGAQGNMVRIADDMVKAGKEPEEILAFLDKVIEEQQAYFLVDDLKHLYKGGRLSASSALIGSMLNIKPILMIDGPITVAEKVRSMKKGINRVIELLEDHKSQHPDLTFKGMIHHANRLEEAQAFKEKLEDKLGIPFEIVDFRETLGTHLGEGALAALISPVFEAQ